MRQKEIILKGREEEEKREKERKRESEEKWDK